MSLSLPKVIFMRPFRSNYHLSKPKPAMDEILDVLTDHTVGDQRPSTAAFLTALGLVLGAALFFALIYLRRKRIVAQRDKAVRLNLIRQGQLDLRRRCLRPDGTVRQQIFQQNGENGQTQSDSDVENDAAASAKDKSVSNQIFETLTSGKLVKMINNFHVKKKSIDKRIEGNVTAVDRYHMEREARLADESVNPLYQMKRSRFATSGDRADSSASSNNELSSSDTEVSCSMA